MFVQNKGDWGNIFSFYWNEVKKCCHFFGLFSSVGLFFVFYFLVFYGILFEKEGEGAKD